MSGVEYYAHTWEFGPRKANENRFPVGLPPDGPDWRTLGAPKPARRDTP